MLFYLDIYEFFKVFNILSSGCAVRAFCKNSEQRLCTGESRNHPASIFQEHLAAIHVRYMIHPL